MYRVVYDPESSRRRPDRNWSFISRQIHGENDNSAYSSVNKKYNE